MKFRKEIIDIRGKWIDSTDPKTGETKRKLVAVDPWSLTTIAGVCQQIYKSKFLKENYTGQLEDGSEIDLIKRDGVFYVQRGPNNDLESVESQGLKIQSYEYKSSPTV